MIISKGRQGLFAALAFIALSASVTVQSAAASDDAWHFTVAVPLWATSISGEVTTRRNSDVPLSASFSELLGHLDMALMAHAEARNGELGFAGDLYYSRVGTTVSREAVLPSLRQLDINVKQTIVETFAFLRVLHFGQPENPR